MSRYLKDVSNGHVPAPRGRSSTTETSEGGQERGVLIAADRSSPTAKDVTPGGGVGSQTGCAQVGDGTEDGTRDSSHRHLLLRLRLLGRLLLRRGLRVGRREQVQVGQAPGATRGVEGIGLGTEQIVCVKHYRKTTLCIFHSG